MTGLYKALTDKIMQAEEKKKTNSLLGTADGEPWVLLPAGRDVLDKVTTLSSNGENSPHVPSPSRGAQVYLKALSLPLTDKAPGTEHTMNISSSPGEQPRQIKINTSLLHIFIVLIV